MTSFQQRQDQFLGFVLDAAGQTGLLSNLQAWLDALPYYGDPDVESAHRGALSTVLQSHVPNDAIAAEPNDNGSGYYTSYAYKGSYSGYADAFFESHNPSSVSLTVASAMQEQNSRLDAGWWQRCALAVVTDAARQAASVSVDSGKLSADLSAANADLTPALTASYLTTLQIGYQPTAAAFQAMIATGQITKASAELINALSASAFIANINAAIGMGGDSTNAAVWLLYNLWVSLKALGSTDVDGQIRALQAAGLIVPAEVGPHQWWSGGYISWFTPLAGPDAGTRTGILTADMPERTSTSYPSGPPMPPVTDTTAVPNGYSQSLCLWGSLNVYRPKSSSCFGAGTGVLLADGSVKAIENIGLGDEVMSGGGTGKVVLVEKPARLGRPLYSVNGLDVRATSGHPFRAADGPGPRRRAVDPWNLIDAVPTMTADGVGALVPGVALAGVGSEPVTVHNVATHDPAEGAADELVYDLVVDNGERGHAVYYVGGPDTFLAVDSETADPWYDTAATLGVVAAMDVALDSVRKYVLDPNVTLPGKLGRLDLMGVREAGSAATGTPPERPKIPGPEYYLSDGEWDPHASALESHLVRQFGRMFRRHSATGWRTGADAPSPNDRFTVCLEDIELLGDVPVGPVITAELSVRGWSNTEDLVQQVTLPSGTKQPQWHLTPDTIIDFGRIHTEIRPAVLVGSLCAGDTFLGRFRAAITDDSLTAGSVEHFLFDESGNAIGRIAIHQRRVSSTDFVLEHTGTKTWSKRDAWAVAIGTGRELGTRLAAHVKQPRT